jgi:DNA replication protein DnaC
MLNQRQASAAYLLNTILPKRARTMTLSSYDTGGIDQNKRALDAARNFVDNYPEARENGWIMGFWGEPRAGKTHLAVGVAQAITKRYGARPMLLNLPKAMTAERERFRNPDLSSPLAEAKNADIVVLDDLGAEYERQQADQRVSWLTEQLYQLIDDRFMKDLPTIYTTNLSPSDMETRYGNEAWKRVLARIETAQVASLEVLRTDIEIVDKESVAKIMAPRD